MNVFVIFSYLTIFSVDYMAKKLMLLNRYFVLLPELLSAFAVLYILARVIAGRRLNLDWRYGLFFTLLFLTFMIGIAAQSVPSGAVVSGLRDQIRFLPFFLLPAVYDFSERQIKTQVTVLMALITLQIPLAVYQRFFQFGSKLHTGDYITGSTASSSALSIVMVCGIAALVVMYLRKRLGLTRLLLLSALFLLPTTINETKGTVILLPFAMVAPFFFMRDGARPARRLIPVLGIFIVGAITFVSIYDALLQYRHPGASIQTFYTEGGVQEYLYRDSASSGDHRIGRLDSIEIAAIHVAKDPLTAAFGLGIGNVSVSILPSFAGEYAGYYERYQVAKTQISHLLWETGAAGLIVYALFYFWVFRDAKYLARSESSFSALGQTWATIMVIMTLALLYKSFFTMNEIVYPFWFFSGLVATKVYALRREKSRQSSRTDARDTSQVWGAPQPASVTR